MGIVITSADHAAQLDNIAKNIAQTMERMTMNYRTGDYMKGIGTAQEVAHLIDWYDKVANKAGAARFKDTYFKNIKQN